MFARMTTIRIKPGEIDRAITTFRKSVLPAAKTQRGFRGACLLVDRQGGIGIAVTFWPTEKTASVNETEIISSWVFFAPSAETNIAIPKFTTNMKNTEVMTEGNSLV